MMTKGAYQELTLRDRPKWWVSRVVGWIAVVVAGLAAFTASSWVWSALEMATFDGEPAWPYVARFLGPILGTVIPAGLVVGALWVLAAVADRIDQKAWLAASEEDRRAIYARRKRRSANA